MSAMWTRAARLAAPALALWLAACSADKPTPAALQPITPTIAGRQVWSTQIGSVSFPLQVAVRAGQFVVASDDGTVAALDAATGRELWRAQVGARLSAGVGSDGRFAAVATRDQQLVLLDGGAQRWSVPLEAGVVTPPLVAGERVFVLGVDRAVHAFDALDGRRLWTFRRPGDPLMLAHPGLLAAWQDTLLVGQGARLVALDPLKGSLRWEVAVTSPRGTNEVERLADLAGPASRVGDSFCVRAFQNAVGCVNAATRSLQWSQNGGGQKAIGGDASIVVGADASDRVTARQRAGGGLAWTSELLLNRGLSAPVVAGPAVVFGDFEGQLHFLAKDTGAPLLRLPTDGARIAAPLVLSDTNLLAVTAKGGVFAFRPE
ncbi:outer membrane protein assembly factor BamB [Ideonella sp. 4Y16]|uniref:Outer membrane protein assembly factor BamB n=1 Tax=Ideonella alba TaxID=2824118 RepID=A0A940YD03_9BURK|nr:outer membrane protein assembly factor BamB [Ideonella alba]MBQ0930866.1 outer membrane protein assembly factor BamB [Ideonella alba]MBQ0942470.1 outer membrane protein assembly factor BamB [Ideonella alba]